MADTDDYYIIEHRQQHGYFLFDIEQVLNIKELSWVPDSYVCMAWPSEKATLDFIFKHNIPMRKLNIIEKP